MELLPFPKLITCSAGWGALQLPGEATTPSVLHHSQLVLNSSACTELKHYKISTTCKQDQRGDFCFDLQIRFLMPFHFKDSILYLPMIKSLRRHSRVRATKSYRGTNLFVGSHQSPTCGANCAGKGCVILTAAAADWNCFWYTMLFILLDWLLGLVELALKERTPIKINCFHSEDASALSYNLTRNSALEGGRVNLLDKVVWNIFCIEASTC